MDYLQFTSEKLSVEDVSDLVISPFFEAISLFIDTSTVYLENKDVASFDYEERKKMALKILTDVCHEIRSQWQSVGNIAIYHRLGTIAVKEAGVIIAVSSNNRSDAIKATESCIEHLKRLVPIWKNERNEDDLPKSKENNDSLYSSPQPKKSTVHLEQEVLIPYEPPHSQQVKVTKEEMNRRIETFLNAKMNEVNVKNIAEFCSGDRSSEFKCARIDSTMKKQSHSKGHLQVNRVLNTYYHRDQFSSEYLTKYIPPNGVEERLQNLESQLSLKTPVPNNIYRRIKFLEDRMLYLESISPEYIQFWEKTNTKFPKTIDKKKFNIEEIDSLIRELEKDV